MGHVAIQCTGDPAYFRCGVAGCMEQATLKDKGRTGGVSRDTHESCTPHAYSMVYILVIIVEPLE